MKTCTGIGFQLHCFLFAWGLVFSVSGFRVSGLRSLVVQRIRSRQLHCVPAKSTNADSLLTTAAVNQTSSYACAILVGSRALTDTIESIESQQTETLHPKILTKEVPCLSLCCQDAQKVLANGPRQAVTSPLRAFPLVLTVVDRDSGTLVMFSIKGCSYKGGTSQSF